MKNTLDKLLSLLEYCTDNSEEASKLQLLVEITQSTDYKELGSAVALRKPFNEFFSLPRLEEVGLDELIKREDLLPQLVSFHSILLKCIRSGNGSELSSCDYPDFTSVTSLTELRDRIRLSFGNTNYSNISDADAMELFSEKTIKSAKILFDMLPVSLTSSETITEEDINNNLENALYCVPIDEFERVHQEFLAFSQNGESIVRNEKTRRKKHALFKIATILVCFGAAFGFSQFGLFSEAFEPILYVILLAASVIFMIWG